MIKREIRILSIHLVLLLGLFCLATSSVQAQDLPESVETLMEEDSSQSIYQFMVVARGYGDSVVLRWLPQDAGVWRLASHYGWRITRLKTDEEMDANPADSTIDMLLTPNPIKALTLDEMKEKYDSTHFYVGVAAQALYGESYYKVKESDGFENFVFRKDQEQTQRQAMAYLAAEGHIDAADALGLRFVDKTVKKNELYSYTIECLIPQDIVTLPIRTIDVFSNHYERTEDDIIPEIRFYQNSPYTVFVYWAKNKLSGYYVERSEDNGKHWKALNDAPIFGYQPDEATYSVFGQEIGEILEANVGTIDSLPLKKKFIYRVKAFDAFGDYPPEQKSEPFEMVDLIPPTVPVLDVVIPENNEICHLEWYMDKQDDDLKGFVVTFSDDPGGPWREVSDLLSPSTRKWVDKNAHDRGRGYYRLFASDNNNNVSYSLSQINNIEDDVAPSAPLKLGGVVDTAGVVYLQWDKNPEKDVIGYRIYFANQLDHEFIQKTSQCNEELFFWDTLSLHTLTKYIYYYVVAEDYSHNMSKPSDTLAIPVPDIVPPGVALLKDYTQTDESVTFTWLQSTSNDVIAYVVYRKKDNEKQWKAIRIISPAELTPGEPFFLIDFPEPSAVNYNYCIEVFDNSRLSSGKTGETTVRFRGASVIDIPLTLKASLNKDKNCAILDFTYDYKSKNDYYGVIFKSEGDNPPYACASFNRGETSYTDCNLKSGVKTTYFIRMYLGKGKRSQPSAEVTVTPK
ncbi:MAG: hypothetical protein K6A41_01585 [Bacteroidales bacterium]|nr:hypothetical protein [Bacteroidales bacterium]